MKQIRFEIETITPMFLSGADQTKAELRAPSIKGLLRFWWRALQAESDVDALREKESRIFGSAGQSGSRASSFSLRLLGGEQVRLVSSPFPSKDDIHKIIVHSNRRGKTFPINILEYLAYGPYDPRTKRLRQYIEPKSFFTLSFSFLDGLSCSEILFAIYAFTLFGGIGSRNRNGFGSFHVLNMKEAFRTIEADVSLHNPYEKANILRLRKDMADITPYTGFSKGTRLFRTSLKSTWDEALAEVGKIYRGIRVGDRKLANSAFELKHKYEKRQYLGAPLDPFQEDFHSALERHAKPYFIKVAREGERYRSYVLYLPSLYAHGLSEARNKLPLNHSEMDRHFLAVCKEFNGYLEAHLETVV